MKRIIVNSICFLPCLREVNLLYDVLDAWQRGAKGQLIRSQSSRQESNLRLP